MEMFSFYLVSVMVTFNHDAPCQYIIKNNTIFWYLHYNTKQSQVVASNRNYQGNSNAMDAIMDE